LYYSFAQNLPKTSSLRLFTYYVQSPWFNHGHQQKRKPESLQSSLAGSMLFFCPCLFSFLLAHSISVTLATLYPLCTITKNLKPGNLCTTEIHFSRSKAQQDTVGSASAGLPLADCDIYMSFHGRRNRMEEGNRCCALRWQKVKR
jgi:hypothetical protein